MKNAVIRIVILLLLQTPWLQPSLSTEIDRPKVSEDSLKQERIYRSQGFGVPHGYTTDRGLERYVDLLSFDFEHALADLGPKDRWLDIGAGESRAMLDYYDSLFDIIYWEGRERRGTKARAVAISIEDRRTSHWHRIAAGLEANKIRYLSGRRLREYSMDELGRFALITDVFGGFSYTENISEFMEKVLAVLEMNGSFYTLLQNLLPEQKMNGPDRADSPYLTEIAKPDGSDLRVCSWLKSITCVEATCNAVTDFDQPIEAFRIRKVCNEVKVPALLQIHFKAGAPPKRRFRLAK